MKKIVAFVTICICVFMMSASAVALVPVDKKRPTDNTRVDEPSIKEPGQKKKNMKSQSIVDDYQKKKKEEQTE